MKTSTLFVRGAAIACGFSVWTLSATTAGAPLAPRTAAAAQDRYTDFTTKLKPFLQLKAYDEIGKLMRSYQEETVAHLDLVASNVSMSNSEENEREFQILNRCWKDTFKSQFSENLYSYHSTLANNAARRRERQTWLERYRETVAKFSKNLSGTKDGPIFEICGEEFVALSDAFESVGDLFYAGRCASGAGTCFDTLYRGKDANLPRTCKSFGRTVEMFDKLDLKYSLYHECKARWEALVREGHGPAAPPDPNAPVPTGPTVEPTAAVVVTTAFEALKTLEDIQRPTFTADELYPVWPVISLGGKGSSGSFMALENGPAILRPDAAKVGLDLDRDGTADKLFGITGNLTTVDFEIGQGEEKRKWAFVFKTGIQEDTFQGLKTNLAPDDKQMRFYVMNAASVLTTINGVPFRVIDDNMDGFYGSDPRTYSYGGLSEGLFQPEFDCVVIGESKRARPWSQYQEINGSWFEILPEKAGMSLRVTPVQLETGTIKLDFKGPTPSWLVLRGTGKYDKFYIDLINEAKKPVAVPTGTYELFAGEVRAGKKQQTMKALILPGPATKKFNVVAGKETVVQFGAPFSFDFMTEVAEEAVTVQGKTVTVVGSSFERYERTWNCVPRPEVSVRKAGAKKGGKPEKMDIVQDLLEVDENNAYKYSETDTWRPINTTFPIKKGEKVEVQLIEKKNKLFGEIESLWK